MGSIAEIEKTQSSMDPAVIPNIGYARGFLERNLHPDSLWSISTKATNVYLTDEASGASAPSSALVTASSSTDVAQAPDISFVRMHEIKSLAKYFLGQTQALLNRCPAAKHSSKVMGLPNPGQYLPKPPPPPPPKHGGVVLKWHRDPRWDLGDSDVSSESGSDID